MAGAVGKLDSVFGGVMPENAPAEAQYVTIASPDSGNPISGVANSFV
jgi:hypothetical protein